MKLFDSFTHAWCIISSFLSFFLLPSILFFKKTKKQKALDVARAVFLLLFFSFSLSLSFFSFFIHAFHSPIYIDVFADETSGEDVKLVLWRRRIARYLYCSMVARFRGLCFLVLVGSMRYD
ncbi:hypothetical protein HOY80DRAFT_988883 [Tuber brumale]|nr:hypothetical protein HOY80DRAFT_988883 [Tuber brumale]